MSLIPIASLANGTVYTTVPFVGPQNPTGAELLTPAAGQQVHVYTHDTTTPVAVYTNESGLSPASQPLITGADGSVPGFIDTAILPLDLVVNGEVYELPALGSGGSGAVQSVAGKTGVVVLTPSDVGADASGAAAAEQTRALAAEALLAPKASPALSGTPTAPTAAALTNTTQVATTAYADGAVSVEKTRALAAEALLAPLASPSLTGAPTAPTPVTSDNSTKVATTAFVKANGGAGVAAPSGSAANLPFYVAPAPSGSDDTAAFNAMLAAMPTDSFGLGLPVGEVFLQSGIYNLGGSALAAPAAPVPTTAASGGTILAGTYQVEVVYVNAQGKYSNTVLGETTPSAAGPVTTTGSTSTITIPSPSAAGSGAFAATGWYAYVTQVNGATFTRQQAAGSPTAIGTNLTLTAPPTSSGLNPQTQNTTGDVNNIGPFVKLLGPGKSVCTIQYNGNGNALYCHNPHRPNPTPGFLSMEGWASVIDGFTIDGTNAGANAVGLHYGDNESGTLGGDLHIQLFQGASAIGLRLNSTVWWLEKLHINWTVIRENTTGVYVNWTQNATNSFGYNDWRFVIFSNINQTGINWVNGFFYNSELHIRGKSIGGAGNTASLLLMAGGQIQQSYLDIQYEGNAANTPGHVTINFQGGVIQQCTGMIAFQGSGMTNSNFVNSATPVFSFFGIISGDTALNPDSSSSTQLGSPVAVGAQRNRMLGFYDSVGHTIYMGSGDFFDLGTLTSAQALTLAFSLQSQTGMDKVIRVKQPASGTVATITWPTSGGAKVKWASGTAPTGGITQTLGAEDWFVLRSYPGTVGPVIYVAQQIPAVA